MHILLVDDDANSRALIADLIRQDRPAAEIVDVDGEAGLARHLEGRAVDLAITDRTLRWGDGLDIFRRIKASHPDCCVIMYSGAAGEDYAVEAMKAGVDDYIVKDVAAHQSRLRSAIRAFLLHGEQRRKMRLTQRRYDDLFQRVTVGLFTCNADGVFIDANPALLAMLGARTLADLAHRRFSDVFAGVDLPRTPAGLSVGHVGDVQVRVRSNDGRELTALFNVYPLSDGDNQIQGVLTNVTDLRKALDEKTTLLREVYHRVYNNLQLVISLLGMQSRRFPSPDVQSGFREVMDRVRSLSLVQQKLYRAEEYSAVDFAAYLRDLTNSLVPPAKAADIAVVLDLAPLMLPIDKAVPLGLLANELLMNAIKHAFPDRQGAVTVRIESRPDNRVMVSIADNGIGVDPSALTNSSGVGGRLIHQLALQADAKVTMVSKRGLTAMVEFDRRASA